ncbi:MAG: cob(I)yrinic acid a,c-diamide adenosyltransferase [Thermoplasmatota archaeon]
MDEPRFHDPHVGISKVYTKTGDAGETSLVGGARVPKDHARIEAYGTVDELNCLVGLARGTAASEPHTRGLADRLLRVQHQLFNLGSALSTLPKDMRPGQPRVADTDVADLEAEMDRLSAELAPLRSFVLPGGSRLNAQLHLCRAVARRAERHTVTLQRSEGGVEVEVRYLNRLSDAFFVWSRWAAKALGHDETLWQPNEA